MNFKKNILYSTGNALIAFSILGFIFTFFPLVLAYLPHEGSQTASKSGYTLEIPKIQAFAPIILNVNPFNESEYKKALKLGVAHAKGTSLPGSLGKVYLFAHSSGFPWEITRYNTIFLRLGELNKNDKIIIKKDKITFTYIVTNKKIVTPESISYILQTTKNELILQTCSPIGTSINRLLILAMPVKQN